MTGHAIVETPGFVRRTYSILASQDAEIQERKKRTGNSWSTIVRELIARGLDAEADDARAKAILAILK